MSVPKILHIWIKSESYRIPCFAAAVVWTLVAVAGDPLLFDRPQGRKCSAGRDRREGRDRPAGRDRRVDRDPPQEWDGWFGIGC